MQNWMCNIDKISAELTYHYKNIGVRLGGYFSSCRVVSHKHMKFSSSKSHS